MTTIYLIRHGEAEGNVFRRFHGQYNSLLTPRGLRQTECVRKRFENIRIDGCFSSDLTRACLTARSIYVPKGLQLIRDARFREVSIGIWEDIPYGYLENFEPKDMYDFNHNPTQWRVEGAETFDVYTQRFLEGLRDAAESYDGGSIAVFAHGAVIRGTLMRLFFRNDLGKLPYSDNTGVCKLFYYKGEFSYEFLNDNAHIAEELSTFYLQRWWRSTNNRKESAVYFQHCPIPPGLDMRTEGDVRVAVVVDRPVGAVCLGGQCADTGEILDLAILPEYEGRFYGDQLLGEAVSHFRKLGCKQVKILGHNNPDDILGRYCTASNMYSIDADSFDWTKRE